MILSWASLISINACIPKSNNEHNSKTQIIKNQGDSLAIQISDSLTPLEGCWELYQQFNDIKSDTVVKKETKILIHSCSIAKYINGKKVFIDTLAKIATIGDRQYVIKSRPRDFIKYNSTKQILRYFIDGQDGTREIYKRCSVK